MINENIRLVAGAARRWRLSLVREDSSPVELSAYRFYGGAASRYRKEFRTMETVSTAPDEVILQLPPLPYGERWHHQIYMQDSATSREWLILSGSIDVLERLGEDAAASTIAEAESYLRCTLSSTTDELEGTFLTAGPRGPQGEQGPKGDKGDPGAALTYADLSDEQKQDLASRACYKEATLFSGNGAGDADMCVRWAQLSVSHLPAMDKPLREVRIPCCTTASAEMDTEPRYLGLWVEEEDGSFSLLGVSSAPARQVVGQETVWPFAGDIVLEVSRPVRLRLLSSPTGTWDDPPLVLGARGKAADADGCYVCNTSGGTQNTQLEMSVTMLDRTPLFTPISHMNDESKHVTLADKVFLNSARNNTLGAIKNDSYGVTISNRFPSAPADNFVCIGPLAEHWYDSVIIGYGATAGQIENGSVAVGFSARADGGLAVGFRAYAYSGVAVGSYARSYGSGVAVGDNSFAESSKAVALGSLARAVREGGLALGSNALAGGANAVALGRDAYVADDGVVGLCSQSSREGIYSMLYFVGAKTPLAYKSSAAGDAFLGYIEVDSLAGKKLCSYRKSLYDLLDIDESFDPTGWENIGYYYT